MPLPRLELEIFGFDTMLGFMHQPDEPKSLSSWEEVGNPLILHNNLHVSIVCLCTCVCPGGNSLPMYLVFFNIYSNNATICSSPAYSIKIKINASMYFD